MISAHLATVAAAESPGARAERVLLGGHASETQRGGNREDPKHRRNGRLRVQKLRRQPAASGTQPSYQTHHPL